MKNLIAQLWEEYKKYEKAENETPDGYVKRIAAGDAFLKAIAIVKNFDFECMRGEIEKAVKEGDDLSYHEDGATFCFSYSEATNAVIELLNEKQDLLSN